MTDTTNRSVTLAAVMLPAQANPQGTVHGGEIMKMMDSAAGCAAIKYARNNMVTARVDELQFLQPVHIADFVTCDASVVYVGTTSLEVFVTVDVERLRGPEGAHRALEAYFTMVSIDENGRPTPVPPFTPETPEEIARWELVAARRARARASR